MTSASRQPCVVAVTALLALAAVGCHPFEDVDDYPYPGDRDGADSGSDADVPVSDTSRPETSVPDTTSPPDFVVPDQEEPDFVVCTGPFDMQCDNVCADLMSNRDHCGDCNQHCSDGAACIGGECMQVRALSVQNEHGCVLVDDPFSTVVAWCWGHGANERLGHFFAPGPDTVAGVAGEVVAVAAGWRHSCALDAAQNIWCWGDNTSGQVTQDAASESEYPQMVPWPHQQGFPAWEGVAAGGSHSCGFEGSRVWCWGQGLAVEGAWPFQLTGLATRIVSGYDFGCALLDDGRVECWGGIEGAPPLDEGEVWVGIAAGARHACAWTRDGIWCWGDNTSGQVAPELDAELTSWYIADASIVDVGLGDHVTCVVSGSEGLVCWGMLPGASGAVRKSIAAPAGAAWLEVDAGDRHVCALADTGDVWCFGDNDVQQLGACERQPLPPPGHAVFAGRQTFGCPP